ncbi:MAG TPA: hypothetical protein VHU23_13205 [Rhizomicrobium sp.]|nr:hypothetical protein [Rhizomicrobium sp.]
MRILDHRRKRWLGRHAQRSYEAKHREKVLRAQRRRATRIVTLYFQQKQLRQKMWVAGRIPMPAIFCLEERYEQSAEALKQARSMLDRGIERYLRIPELRRKRPRKINNYLDFSTIERLSPSAALCLASEFHRVRLLIRTWNFPLVDLNRWRRSILGSLEDIGFFELLEIQKPKLRVPDQRITRFSSGEVASGTQARLLFEKLALIIDGLDEQEGLDQALRLSRQRLYAALVEATENTRAHAYEGLEEDPFVARRWWMTGSVNPEKKSFTIAVYDQGVSIPACLPKWRGYGWIKKGFQRLFGKAPEAFDESYDGYRIRLAMNAPLSSSSGLAYRGKGFPAYKDVLQECRGGRLRILSRRGEFLYVKGRRPRSRTLEMPLQGTLVEWDLQV